MAKGYAERVYEQMRNKVHKTSKETEREILKVYEMAGNDLVNKFRKSKEGSASRAYYASYIRSLNSEITRTINESGLKVSEIPVNVQRLMSEEIFKRAGIPKNLINNFNQSYGKIPKNVMSKIITGDIYKDSNTLSNRIWGNSIKAGNNIQSIVTSGLSNKISAVEMARTLEVYVNPSARKTWDREKIRGILGDGYAGWNNNLEYNSLRLARTTITHASQISNIDSCRMNPYIKSIQWFSVLAHGRTCEICKARHEKIFLLDEMPLDHPNGLCYQTAVLDKSLNDIADELKEWVNGKDNVRLDNWEKGPEKDAVQSIKNGFVKGNWGDKEYKGIIKDVDKRLEALQREFPVSSAYLSEHGDMLIMKQEAWDKSFVINLENYLKENPTVKKAIAKNRVIKTMVDRPEKVDVFLAGSYSEDLKRISINRNSIGENITLDESLAIREKKLKRDLERLAEGRRVRPFMLVGEGSEATMIHEYGHAIKSSLGLSSDSPIHKYYNSLSEDEISMGISSYASTNIDEFFAECFTESYMPGARPIAVKFMELLKGVKK